MSSLRQSLTSTEDDLPSSSLIQSLTSTEESDEFPSSSPPETDKTPEQRSPNTARDGKISKRLKTTMYYHGISFKRCSVTNYRESKVVTLHNAHVLHKSVSDVVVSYYPFQAAITLLNICCQLSMLEYWWQMRYKSLNVDSRDNIIRCKLSGLFSNSHWWSLISCSLSRDPWWIWQEWMVFCSWENNCRKIFDCK